MRTTINIWVNLCELTCFYGMTNFYDSFVKD